MNFYVMFAQKPDHTMGEAVPYVEQEAQHSYQCYKAGKVLDMQYTAGTILPVHSRWECSNRAELDALLADFPMVKAGLLSTQVYELAPYERLERLKQERD